MATACPLCQSAETERFAEVDAKTYLRCRRCALTFLPPRHHPPPERERREYLLHENAPDDAGYRRFLARLLDPLLERVPAGAEGLDFGCGPVPVLALMCRERGRPTRAYDPFFHPDRAALARTYDFIACSETAEHFHRPRRAFERLPGLGGGIARWPAVAMNWYGAALVFDHEARSLTARGEAGAAARLAEAVSGPARPLEAGFAAWHYRRDVTHVAFYRPETMRWIARRFGYTCEILDERVVLFTA